MARWRAGLLLLLLSLAGLAVLHLTLGTTTIDVTAAVFPTHPTSPTPMDTSALLPTSASTTETTTPPSNRETGAATLERSSTALWTSSASSPTTPPPTAPAQTDTSSEPLKTPSDTTSNPNTITSIPETTSYHSQPVGTTARTTRDISTLTKESDLCTSTVPETSSAATGTEPSSPVTDSTPTTEAALSTPADLSTTLPVCPTPTSNTSASLFVSLRLTIPLDLGNTTVQEMVLSKLRVDLQTRFPCAGLAVGWRGKKRI
ncbi:integumentary mucin A.1-like isoform X2 [Phaenicophaeus curvirostris]|uniref:integumentary mucin A.1-like isoform X2 n=1 Tax=Phaenicophaeus curvirostris TaxID=33595 RepID=UPI0037F09901